MKHFSFRPTRLLVIPLLLALVFFAMGSHLAFALVFSQHTGLTKPTKTFCLPTQKVDGVHKVPGTNNGLVDGGGFSFDNSSGSPIATLWTISNGPTKGNLHIVSQVTSSFSVVKEAVPIGSFYRTCMTNITNVLVSFSIQQTESTFCCSSLRRAS